MGKIFWKTGTVTLEGNFFYMVCADFAVLSLLDMGCIPLRFLVKLIIRSMDVVYPVLFMGLGPNWKSFLKL